MDQGFSLPHRSQFTFPRGKLVIDRACGRSDRRLIAAIPRKAAQILELAGIAYTLAMFQPIDAAVLSASSWRRAKRRTAAPLPVARSAAAPPGAPRAGCNSFKNLAEQG